MAWKEPYRATPAALSRMIACIEHRGPDGEGVLSNHQDPATHEHPHCALGHRRLAIIDLDARANQPMAGPADDSWIVFNGEIYNYRELRQEIDAARPGYPWRTTSDTEVLLAAYHVWREGCLAKLNGMFAFAIWDEKRGELFMVRDRMGQKPLYWAAVGEDGRRWERPVELTGIGGVGRPRDGSRPGVAGIAFASELSALRAVGWVDGRLDSRALAHYLCWGYVPAPQTIFLAANKLAPATWMRLGPKGVEGGTYYCPEKAPTPGLRSRAAQTRELVMTAVRRQLVADVPVGCFLSGGIDSSIMAAAMKAAAGKDQKILTFSIGFDDPRYNETQYADSVANQLGTEHRKFIVTPDAAADLPKLAAVFGEPFADSSALPTHYLARETRKYVKVAISGDGGDELFGGYDRYRALQMGEYAQRLPTPFREIVQSPLWQKLPGWHPKNPLSRIKRFLGSLGGSASQRYASYMRLFDAATLAELVNADLCEPVEKAGEWIERLYEAHREMCGVVESALAVDRLTYLPEDLLTKVDRAAMLHALEVRSPFMDHEVVEFAATLPCEQLLRGDKGKWVLREAFKADLPADVLSRGKMGFAVPIGDWLRTSLRDMLHDLVLSSQSFASRAMRKSTIEKLLAEHEEKRVDHSQRLYGLLMLELWWRSGRG